MEEAAKAMLSNETKEVQPDSSNLAEEARKPTSPQPCMVSMRNLVDIMHTAHKAYIPRTDTSYISHSTGRDTNTDSMSIQPVIISFPGNKQYNVMFQ